MFKSVLVVHGHSREAVETAYRATFRALRATPGAPSLNWRGWCEEAPAADLAREFAKVDAVWDAHDGGVFLPLDPTRLAP
jgi:hypothetical protein